MNFSAETQADIDTPADALLLARHPGLGPALRSFIEQQASGDLLGKVDALRRLIGTPASTLAIIGRSSSRIWQALELRKQIWVRLFVEERGMLASGRAERGEVRSLIGELLLFCRAMDRLGLGELGYGFTGKGGASMRSYVESYLWMGYPRTIIPGGMPRYCRVSMGDARGGSIFQHTIVPGYAAGTEARSQRTGRIARKLSTQTTPANTSSQAGLREDRDRASARSRWLCPRKWLTRRPGAVLISC
jgi:hypothetical protein